MQCLDTRVCCLRGWVFLQIQNHTSLFASAWAHHAFPFLLPFDTQPPGTVLHGKCLPITVTERAGSQRASTSCRMPLCNSRTRALIKFVSRLNKHKATAFLKCHTLRQTNKNAPMQEEDDWDAQPEEAFNLDSLKAVEPEPAPPPPPAPAPPAPTPTATAPTPAAAGGEIG